MSTSDDLPSHGGKLVAVLNLDTLMVPIQTSPYSPTPAALAQHLCGMRAHSSSFEGLTFAEVPPPAAFAAATGAAVGCPVYVSVQASRWSAFYQCRDVRTSELYQAPIVMMVRRFARFWVYHALKCSFSPFILNILNGHVPTPGPSRAVSAARGPSAAATSAALDTALPANNGIVVYSHEWSEEEMMNLLELGRIGVRFNGAQQQQQQSTAISSLPTLVAFSQQSSLSIRDSNELRARASKAGVIVVRSLISPFHHHGVSSTGPQTGLQTYTLGLGMTYGPSAGLGASFDDKGSALGFGSLLPGLWSARLWGDGIVMETRNANANRWSPQLRDSGQLVLLQEEWQELAEMSKEPPKDTCIALVARLMRVCEVRAAVALASPHCGSVVSLIGHNVLRGCKLYLNLQPPYGTPTTDGGTTNMFQLLSHLHAQEGRYQTLLKQLAERCYMMSKQEEMYRILSDNDEAVMGVVRAMATSHQSNMSSGYSADSYVRQQAAIGRGRPEGIYVPSYPAGSPATASSYVWPSVTSMATQMVWEMEDHLPFLIRSHGGTLDSLRPGDVIPSDATYILDCPGMNTATGADAFIGLDTTLLAELFPRSRSEKSGPSCMGVADLEELFKPFLGSGDSSNGTTADNDNPNPRDAAHSSPSGIISDQLARLLATITSLYEYMHKCREAVAQIAGHAQAHMRAAIDAASRGSTLARPVRGGIATVMPTCAGIVRDMADLPPGLEGVVDFNWVFQCVRHWRLFPPVFAKEVLVAANTNSSTALDPSRHPAFIGPPPPTNLLSSEDRCVLGYIREAWEEMKHRLPCGDIIADGGVAASLDTNTERWLTANAAGYRRSTSIGVPPKAAGSANSSAHVLNNGGKAPARPTLKTQMKQPAAASSLTTNAVAQPSSNRAASPPPRDGDNAVINVPSNSVSRSQSSSSSRSTSSDSDTPATNTSVPRRAAPIAAPVAAPLRMKSKHAAPAAHGTSVPTPSAAAPQPASRQGGAPTVLPPTPTTVLTPTPLVFDQRVTSLFDSRSSVYFQLLMASALMPPYARDTLITQAGNDDDADPSLYAHLPYSMAGRDEDVTGWWGKDGGMPYLPEGYLTEWSRHFGLAELAATTLATLAGDDRQGVAGAVITTNPANATSLIRYSPTYISIAEYPASAFHNTGIPRALVLGYRRGCGLQPRRGGPPAMGHQPLTTTMQTSTALVTTNSRGGGCELCFCDRVAEADMRYRARLDVMVRDATEELTGVWRVRAMKAKEACQEVVRENARLRDANSTHSQRNAALCHTITSLEDKLAREIELRLVAVADAEASALLALPQQRQQHQYEEEDDTVLSAMTAPVVIAPQTADATQQTAAEMMVDDAQVAKIAALEAEAAQLRGALDAATVAVKRAEEEADKAREATRKEVVATRAKLTAQHQKQLCDRELEMQQEYAVRLKKALASVAQEDGSSAASVASDATTARSSLPRSSAEERSATEEYRADDDGASSAHSSSHGGGGRHGRSGGQGRGGARTSAPQSPFVGHTSQHLEQEQEQQECNDDRSTTQQDALSPTLDGTGATSASSIISPSNSAASMLARAKRPAPASTMRSSQAQSSGGVLDGAAAFLANTTPSEAIEPLPPPHVRGVGPAPPVAASPVMPAGAARSLISNITGMAPPTSPLPEESIAEASGPTTSPPAVSPMGPGAVKQSPQGECAPPTAMAYAHQHGGGNSGYVAIDGSLTDYGIATTASAPLATLMPGVAVPLQPLDRTGVPQPPPPFAIGGDGSSGYSTSYSRQPANRQQLAGTGGMQQQQQQVDHYHQQYQQHQHHPAAHAAFPPPYVASHHPLGHSQPYAPPAPAPQHSADHYRSSPQQHGGHGGGFRNIDTSRRSGPTAVSPPTDTSSPQVRPMAHPTGNDYYGHHHQQPISGGVSPAPTNASASNAPPYNAATHGNRGGSRAAGNKRNRDDARTQRQSQGRNERAARQKDASPTTASSASSSNTAQKDDSSTRFRPLTGGGTSSDDDDSPYVDPGRVRKERPASDNAPRDRRRSHNRSPSIDSWRGADGSAVSPSDDRLPKSETPLDSPARDEGSERHGRSNKGAGGGRGRNYNNGGGKGQDNRGSGRGGARSASGGRNHHNHGGQTPNRGGNPRGSHGSGRGDAHPPSGGGFPRGR